MPQLAIKNKIGFVSYRVSTVLKSLRTLYTLPQEKIDAFLGSYNIFDHDWSNEEELIRDMGPDYYNQVKKKLIDYYSVLNHLCSIGQVEKMYIPPIMDLSKGIIANQKLFEQKMAKDLGIKKGDRVLDIGCGRGRIANHVATITGAHVTGMNIDTDQLECARRFAKGKSMSSQCEFIQGDLNELPLPFPDASMNAVYQVQVFCYSKDLEKLFADIYRVLKPGGRVSSLDWFRLDKYDPKNPEHEDLMRRIKPLIGAIGTPSIADFTNAMEKAGFKIIVNQNASIDGIQAPLIENADKLFTWATRIINSMVKCRVLPGHFKKLFDRLTKDGQAFVEADRKGLVTTCHHIVGEKPL
jgi:sterol 24-C-methyltransferase